ncbi:MAG: family 10 glycosylhydrolase [Bacteroidales bacterium]|nr:family 10 glycosylhydrolase [Bacteroidales bacterium]
MKRALITAFVLAAVAIVGVSACGDDSGRFKTPEWQLPDPTPDPDPTPTPDDTTNTGPVDPQEPVATKPFYIWIDAAANFPDFANSKENIRRDLQLAKDTGFTDVVVDVRPTTGDILFSSSVGSPVEWLGAWTTGGYKKFERTADWDYLQAFIEAGHSLGLRVHAAINTMVGGNKTSLGQQGILYRDESKKSWATSYNLQSGIMNAIDAGQSTLFFNPANPDVQAYLLQLIKDLASYKDLDGIILDRCRYVGLQTDFSNESKNQFMDYIGVVTLEWPSDILPAGTTYSTQPSKLPKYYKKWLEWRAKVIHDFVEKAHDIAHEQNPDIKFGVYVGGWYSQYYDVGVNWAGPGYNTSAYYSTWATADYKNYGFADHCDHMLIGAYANPGAVYGNSEWTMQGFCRLAKQKIGSACPIVAGGPDVGNWDDTDKYSQDEENAAITNSVKACYDACDGYFLFDMIHLKKADQWRYAKAGIDQALGK